MSFLRCIRCVMPNLRPDVPFSNGVCQACINHENRQEVDWEARHAELLRLLDRFNGKCLVPSSGGKDSVFQTTFLRDLGADVTNVTAMTCQPTTIGLANLDNLERYAPCIRVEPDRKVRPKLNRLGLEMVGDISHPEHLAIFSTPFRVAVETGHRLLFYGECPTNHFGGPEGTEHATLMTRRYISEFGGQLGLRAKDFIGLDGITSADMKPYMLPSDADLAPIEAHFLGRYTPWDSFFNSKMANLHGMRQILPTPANWWVGENQDNAQTGIHDWFCYLKYGYGRGCAQASMDIRAGRAERNKVMPWIQQFDGRFPEKYMGIRYEEVLDYIGMTQYQFWDIAKQYTNPEIFYRVPKGTPIRKEGFA